MSTGSLTDKNTKKSCGILLQTYTTNNKKYLKKKIIKMTQIIIN